MLKTDFKSNRNSVMKKISIAIPFYNRSNLIHEALNNILEDERISEIIIQDDFSSDSEFNFISESFKGVEKIKIKRNEKNLGAYFNKLEAVKSCSGEWVILLDSDNYLFTSYIDSVFKESPWDADYCYIADEMLANGNKYPWGRCDGCWDHGRFGRSPIDFNQIEDIWNKDYGIEGLLNAGNYFFNRENYIRRASMIINESSEEFLNPYASDCIAFMYYWLSDGGKIKILENAEYYHRMHSGSLWGSLAAESSRYSAAIRNRFRNEKIK